MVTDYVRGIRANVLAVKHAKSGDYRTASRIWLRASRSRFCDAKILFNLAVCYQHGLGITKDLVKVVYCNYPLNVVAVAVVIFRSTLLSQPNKVGLKFSYVGPSSVCVCIGPSTKSFFDFNMKFGVDE